MNRSRTASIATRSIRSFAAAALLAGLLAVAQPARAGTYVVTTAKNGVHHVTIPRHKPLRIGTLQSILKDIAHHLEMDWSDFLQDLLARQ